MAEITFTPLTDRGSQLLDRLEAEAQVRPFRTTRDGARSYALSGDTVQADGLGRASRGLAGAPGPNLAS